MWYIFDSNDKCIAICDSGVNQEDLKSRGEMAVESDINVPLDAVEKTESGIKRKIVDITKEDKFTALDAEYQLQFAELSQALGMAVLADNADLITSIKADYVELKADYDAKREVIQNG